MTTNSEEEAKFKEIVERIINEKDDVIEREHFIESWPRIVSPEKCSHGIEQQIQSDAEFAKNLSIEIPQYEQTFENSELEHEASPSSAYSCIIPKSNDDLNLIVIEDDNLPQASSSKAMPNFNLWEDCITIDDDDDDEILEEFDLTTEDYKTDLHVQDVVHDDIMIVDDSPVKIKRELEDEVLYLDTKEPKLEVKEEDAPMKMEQDIILESFTQPKTFNDDLVIKSYTIFKNKEMPDIVIESFKKPQPLDINHFQRNGPAPDFIDFNLPQILAPIVTQQNIIAGRPNANNIVAGINRQNFMLPAQNIAVNQNANNIGAGINRQNFMVPAQNMAVNQNVNNIAAGINRQNFLFPVQNNLMSPNTGKGKAAATSYQFAPTDANKAKEIGNLLKSAEHYHKITPIEERIASPKELTCDLLEHQKLALEWMLDKEKSEHHRGGILADEMGLGKTIEALALIAAAKPKLQDVECGTLIICPSSLATQWEAEIEEKIQIGKWKVLLYMSNGKKGATTVKDLAKYDVVITSYSTLSCGFYAPYTKKSLAFAKSLNLENAEFYPEPVLEKLKEQSSVLFKCKWTRILLDEAHFIRNKRTLAAAACFQLDAVYRWCLSGTPVQNSCTDIFSLIKFLRIKPFSDFHVFEDKILRNIKSLNNREYQTGVQRMRQLLKSISLRRTKLTILDGKPIIELPEKKIHYEALEFSKDEMDFYKSLENRQRLRFNRYLRNGTAMRNYSFILVLLLRLRQACCHPSLLSEDFIKELEHTETSVLELIPIHVRNRVLQEKFEAECSICFDICQDACLIIHCGHSFCKDCLNTFISTTIGLRCPNCRCQFQAGDTVESSAFFRKYRPEEFKKEKEELEDVKSKALFDANLTSAKIDRVIELIKNITKENPQEKIIVFSQFTKMLDMVAKFLEQNQLSTTKYNGTLSATQKKNVLEKFRYSPDVNIALISLKCGNVGLNLTCANHLIMLDPWWNVAVENQAIDRIHRLGQKKLVNVYRLSIKDTVEDRILKLQEKKQNLINNIFVTGKAQENHRLGLEELILLFGQN